MFATVRRIPGVIMPFGGCDAALHALISFIFRMRIMTVMSYRRDMADVPSSRKDDESGRLRLITRLADMESGGAALEGMLVGEEDFRELRDKDLYFVDKSLFIDELLKSTAKVTLITRPRRFGKSLNLSMLDSYLNMRYAGGFDYFEGLKISERRPNDSEKNSNVVINVSLMELGNGTYTAFLKGLENRMFELYSDFYELHDSPRLGTYLRIYRRICDGDATEYDLSTCLRDLSRMLELHYGKKVVILIDEYDNTMNAAYGNPEEHQKIVDFMRTFLSTALKGNHSLRFAVVTGVMKISKESIFSGLNNLEVNDVLSDQYDEMYGFTQAEVEKLLIDNDQPDRISEAKEWYDGYRFGSVDVYNPWSIINYVKRGCKPDVYWANTSSNSIIEELLCYADRGRWNELKELCAGGSVAVGIQSEMAFCDLGYTDDAIYSVMVASGYLNAIPLKNGYAVSIPNQEMAQVFARIILERFGPRTSMVLRDLIDAMISGDVEQARSDLEKLMETLSVRMLNDEHSYQAFIAGLMATTHGIYETQADHEAGSGYPDICMKGISGSVPNLIIEVKRRNKGNAGESMEELAQSALRQIRERRYASGLKGETILYGIAFDGKVPTIAMDRCIGTDRSGPTDR